ncbi:hypothetical protein AAHA92_04566 [Salvia divinorum]|uniref:Uncharacterized protein n=1 Tax=Salvia divinorum TaxID=28513 RepID=A0ABD1HZM1_SALDI
MIAILPQGLLALCMLSFLNSKRMLVMKDGQGAIGGEVTIHGFAALLVGFFTCSHHWSFCCLSPSRVSGVVIIKLCPDPQGWRQQNLAVVLCSLGDDVLALIS